MPRLARTELQHLHRQGTRRKLQIPLQQAWHNIMALQTYLIPTEMVSMLCLTLVWFQAWFQAGLALLLQG